MAERFIDADAFGKEIMLFVSPSNPNAYFEILHRLIDAEDVEVKRVIHAHWKGKPLAGFTTVRCSACNSCFSGNSGRWKYCPNCGAKMDEEV